MISSTYMDVVETNIAYWKQRTVHLNEAALASLNKEYPNLLRAVKQGQKCPQTQTHHLAELVTQSYLLVERYGYWHTWLPIMENIITTCVLNDLPLQLTLLKQQGELLRLNRQLQAAIVIHQKAYDIAQKLDDAMAVAWTHFTLSEDYFRARAYNEAEHHGLAALAIFSKQKEGGAGTAATLNTLGLIASERGNDDDLQLAEARLRQAISYRNKIYPQTHLARTYISLAVTLQRQRKYESALEAYQEAEKLLSLTDSELDKSKLHNCLGTLYFEWEQFNQAEAHFRQADSMALRQSGDIFTQAALKQNLANVLIEQGRFNEAESYLRQSIPLWELAHDPVYLANVFTSLCQVLSNQRRYEEATSFHSKALAILEKTTKTQIVEEILKMLSQVCLNDK